MNEVVDSHLQELQVWGLDSQPFQFGVQSLKRQAVVTIPDVSSLYRYNLNRYVFPV